MAEHQARTWRIRVHLTTGEIRHLAGSFSSDEATQEIEAFQTKGGRYQGDWLDTAEEKLIARAHIVEVHPVPLPET
jgi:hypothetical protein